MFQMRHLLLSLASGSALYSAVTPALGLGDAQIHSYLNQPLAAEIELVEVDDLSEQDVHVRLASAEDFNRAGVERFIFLNDLRFSPMLGNGRGIIRVTSSRPVKEPYLNFIVEVARPGGRLLREYTLLIDPPGISAFSMPAQATVDVSQVAQAAPAAPPQMRVPAQMPAAEQGLRYQVRSGDSLWRIAGRLAPAGMNREALMGDILALNPQAFIGGDPSRLRLVELRLPDSLASANTAPAPVVEVAPVVPSTPEQPVQAPVEAVRPEELIEQQAARDAFEQQNLELQQSVLELQAQMLALQEQMQAKDQQLAQLQQLNEQRAEQPVSAPTAVAEQAVEPELNQSGRYAGLWWFAGALGVLALSSWFWRRRKPSALAPAAPVQPVEVVTAPKPVVQAVSAVSSVRVVPEAAPVSPIPDALEGANIYMAYGRFADAAQALRKASEQEPQRVELRLRLLEAYGELNALESFTELEQQLRADGFAKQVDPIQARYASRLKAIAPEQSLVPMIEDTPALVQDDFQLNLDDLTLDADWSLAAPFEPQQPARLKAVEEQWQPDANFKPALNGLPEVSEWSESDEVFQSQLDTEFLLNDNFILDEKVEQLAGSDEHLQQLNQALAFIEVGDISKACDALNEVINSGDEQERDRARELLAKIA